MITLADIPIPAGWRPMRFASGGESRARTEPALWEIEPHDTDPAWPALFMDALATEAQKCGLDLAYVEQIRDPWRTIPNTLHRAALQARRQIRRLAVDDDAKRGAA